ncbi:uncharacterized protein METZ01_LOCUS406449, partial [marine metagenome]
MTLSNPPPNGDHRSNSGLREGNISHAEVNEALRGLPKTIIFGQHGSHAQDNLHAGASRARGQS